MAPAGSLVPFVQFDLPGTGGLPDGKYLVRTGNEVADTVLVCELIGALPARGRLRGRKPEEQNAGEAESTLPVRRVACALPDRFEHSDAADAWLDAAIGDGAAELVAGALALVNQAIAAHRVAAADPAIAEVGIDDPLAIRIGYGSGDELAAAAWTRAIKLPPSRRRKRHPGTEDIRAPQRMAAILSGRDSADPWELHALRAQTDLDAGRDSEAAAEVRAAIASFDAAPPDFAANLREEIAGRLSDARGLFGPMTGGAGPGGAPGSEALADAVDLFSRLQDRRRRPPVD